MNVRLRIGRRNRIFHFASLGSPPQDKKYANEPTSVEIGDDNTIREYVTVSRGTAQDVIPGDASITGNYDRTQAEQLAATQAGGERQDEERFQPLALDDAEQPFGIFDRQGGAVRGINAYYGESHILRNVSFTVSAGEVVCLMGRNGVGKTTTLKVITGLLPARSGDMLFNGSNITKLSTDRRARRGLAIVPQGREIIPHSKTWVFPLLEHSRDREGLC